MVERSNAGHHPVYVFMCIYLDREPRKACMKTCKVKSNRILEEESRLLSQPKYRIESSCSIIALPKSSSSLSLNVIKLPPPKLSQRPFLSYCTDYRGQCSYIEQWEYVQNLKAANWKPLVTIATSPEPYAAWECEYMYYT